MAKVLLSKEDKFKEHIRKFIKGAMAMEDISQREMAEALFMTQQGFSFALKNCSFSAAQLGVMCSKLKLNEEEKARLLTL